ncbi:hypothetical protein [Pseudoalteromonas shioyasakiensis]|uniref:hypothetical protein n=1 Tax=Pseudoalteromonas shioyasakiensis TaxID=1190813 RepID=UPI0022B09A18|nr:hypothetical protein [Pseudoalteromonas shioyasakiensis]MCZ4250654.1 hypothetical protein [Pseudoalteromonas shioyasakiensis]
MKTNNYFVSAILIFSVLFSVNVSAAGITSGKAILTQLASSNNSNLAVGNIITDQQNGAGLQLTGDLVLKLTESVYFADIATRYQLTLKHQVSDFFVVSADSANLSQLLAQLANEQAIIQVQMDTQELGESADPQVENEKEN